MNKKTMQLDQLIQSAQMERISGGGDGNPEVSDIVYNSRKATPGSLFVAVSGTKSDGGSYIDDAIENGAVAVISEREQPMCPVPWIQVKNARKSLGALGKAFWEVNLDEIVTIGITGTNGKTTTAYLFKHLLEQRYGKERVWMFGTIEYQIGSEIYPAPNTTPEGVDIYRFIGAAETKPRAIVMEASSHSLVLHRLEGMRFDCGVWTNLTQDHLDFHSDMNTYYNAKKLLITDYLKSNSRWVVNIDDPWGKKLAEEMGECGRRTFGKHEDADIQIVDSHSDWDGNTVSVFVDGKKQQYHSPLTGIFNVFNMVSVIAGAQALSFSYDEIGGMFKTFPGVPGRMERVPIDAPFTVIVDYAHTPDALVNILQAARPLTNGKLVCVFGCGGDRDSTKRPLMANAVIEHCDEALVTSDNPRSESPGAIVAQVEAAIPLDFPHWVEVDRREAIRRALSIVKPGDCIVIAGKGHEQYQEINGVRHHFNDKEVVCELFTAIGAIRDVS